MKETFVVTGQPVEAVKEDYFVEQTIDPTEINVLKVLTEEYVPDYMQGTTREQRIEIHESVARVFDKGLKELEKEEKKYSDGLTNMLNNIKNIGQIVILKEPKDCTSEEI